MGHTVGTPKTAWLWPILRPKTRLETNDNSFPPHEVPCWHRWLGDTCCCTAPSSSFEASVSNTKCLPKLVKARTGPSCILFSACWRPRQLQVTVPLFLTSSCYYLLPAGHWAVWLAWHSPLWVICRILWLLRNVTPPWPSCRVWFLQYFIGCQFQVAYCLWTLCVPNSLSYLRRSYIWRASAWVHALGILPAQLSIRWDVLLAYERIQYHCQGRSRCRSGWVLPSSSA